MSTDYAGHNYFLDRSCYYRSSSSRYGRLPCLCRWSSAAFLLYIRTAPGRNSVTHYCIKEAAYYSECHWIFIHCCYSLARVIVIILFFLFWEGSPWAMVVVTTTPKTGHMDTHWQVGVRLVLLWPKHLGKKAFGMSVHVHSMWVQCLTG